MGSIGIHNTLIMDLQNILILLIWAVVVLEGNVLNKQEPLVSNKSFFNVNSKEYVQSDNGEHRRVKRLPNLPNIKHLYNEARINEHSQEEKDAILAKHIEYRSKTNPEASNMEYMYWNEELAKLAGLWASVCYWGHGLTNHSTANFSSIGQNLWLGGGKPNGAGQVRSWHDNEVNNYIYINTACLPNRVCGHYTQVVWATSVELGCSRAFCSKLIDKDGNYDGRNNLWIEACHYAPAGNYAGAKPFKSGPSCTQCQSGSGECYDNACRPCSQHNETCDCRQSCHNCGTVTSDCKCACMDGWHGVDCSKACEDTHENCWKSPGWPSPAYCGVHPAIPRHCPLMCGVCVPAGDDECVTTSAPNVTTLLTTFSQTTNQSTVTPTLNVTTVQTTPSPTTTQSTVTTPASNVTSALTTSPETTIHSTIATPAHTTTHTTPSRTTTQSTVVTSVSNVTTSQTTLPPTTTQSTVTTPAPNFTTIRTTQSSTTQSPVTTPASDVTTPVTTARTTLIQITTQSTVAIATTAQMISSQTTSKSTVLHSTTDRPETTIELHIGTTLVRSLKRIELYLGMEAYVVIFVLMIVFTSLIIIFMVFRGKSSTNHERRVRTNYEMVDRIRQK